MPIENELTKAEAIREQKRLEREHWEIVFAKQLDAIGYYYQRQYRFHPTRKWAFDFMLNPYYPSQESMDKFADEMPCYVRDCATLIDIQGGTWSEGAHVRGKGYQNDIDKMNAATALGWDVFWFTSDDVESGKAIRFLEKEVWQSD